MANDGKIDFVILWVDGNDPVWQAVKAKYIPNEQSDNRVQRYRDWDNLKYWFRGVEKFAPWVNKIHFITYGHIPIWLNTKHPKLNIVKHSDYMPSAYLPTFNSNAIELNIHRIKGLSEQFVLFNDDTFIIGPTNKTVFFKNNLPCDSAALNVHCVDMIAGFLFSQYQAIGIINKYFDFHKSIIANWKKWFNLKNGKQMLRTIYLLPCPRFPGIYQPHLPNSFLKSTYEMLWEKEGKLLDETSKHKFREKLDHSQWTFRNWQLASGEFENRDFNIGKCFYLGYNYKDTIYDVSYYISNHKGKLISINDGEMTDKEFKYNKKILIKAFDRILPNKSNFEL